MLDEWNPGGINVSRLSRNTHAESASGGALCYVSEMCNIAVTRFAEASERTRLASSLFLAIAQVTRQKRINLREMRIDGRRNRRVNRPFSLPPLFQNRGLFNFIIRFGLRLREAENFRFMARLGQNPPNPPTRAHLHLHFSVFGIPQRRWVCPSLPPERRDAIFKENVVARSRLSVSRSPAMLE